MAFLPLDEAETDAMLLGLCLVARLDDPGLAEAAERAIGRVEALIPAETSPEGVPPGGPPTGVPGEASARIDAALAAACRLRLLYRDGERQWSRRIVWPVEVTDGFKSDMLVAWCETRGAFRHFRLDRIEHAEPLGDPPGASRRVLLARYRAETIEREG